MNINITDDENKKIIDTLIDTFSDIDSSSYTDSSDDNLSDTNDFTEFNNDDGVYKENKTEYNDNSYEINDIPINDFTINNNETMNYADIDNSPNKGTINSPDIDTSNILYTIINNKDRLINVLKTNNNLLHTQFNEINSNMNNSLHKLNTIGDINYLINKIKTDKNTIDKLREETIYLQNINHQTKNQLLIANNTYNSLNHIYIKQINDIINNPINERLNKVKYNLNMIQKEQERVKQENDLIKSSILCKICHENKIGILLEPCGHIGICKYCFNNIQNASQGMNSYCPICNNIIEQYKEIYIGV